MLYLTALSALVGILSSGISIYLFIESRNHPAFRRRGVVFVLIAAVMLLLAFLLVYSSSANNNQPATQDSPTLPPPTATGTPTPGLTATNTLTPTPTSTPSPTPPLSPTSVAINIAGTHIGTIYILDTAGSYEPYSLTFVVEQNQQEIRGSCAIGKNLSGSFSGTITAGGNMQFTCNFNNGDSIYFSGMVEGIGSMRGRYTAYNPDGTTASSASWSTN